MNKNLSTMGPLGKGCLQPHRSFKNNHRQPGFQTLKKINQGASFRLSQALLANYFHGMNNGFENF